MGAFQVFHTAFVCWAWLLVLLLVLGIYLLVPSHANDGSGGAETTGLNSAIGVFLLLFVLVAGVITLLIRANLS